MRTLPNECLDSSGHDPERRCVLTGERAPKAKLIRLALGPDGQIAPDVRAKAPGRGAWVGVDRVTLAAAQAKGKLKGVLIHTLHAPALQLPDDLAARTEAALERATLDRFGMEARAGHVVTGSEAIATAARAGDVSALFHASDAGADGAKTLAQAWRVGSDAEGTGLHGLTLPVDRMALSAALGRANAVHVALTDAAAAERVLAILRRWMHFIAQPLPAWADTEIRRGLSPNETDQTKETI